MCLSGLCGIFYRHCHETCTGRPLLCGREGGMSRLCVSPILPGCMAATIKRSAAFFFLPPLKTHFMRKIVVLASLAAIVLLASFTPRRGLMVYSPAFSANRMIPMKYSCEGRDVSPALRVSGIPGRARTLALIVHDPDAPKPGGMTHWVVWNLPVNGYIPENFRGAMQGENGNHENRYTGMCPPNGVHHYHFRVYALDTRLNLDRRTGKEELERAMRGHILAEGEIVGLYKKMRR